MCGIAGFFNLKNDPEQNIRCMLDKIVHRGPDSSGIWKDPCDTGLTLGHRRLSILDLSDNGSQPMVSHSRRYVICYNGEIYNHAHLLKCMRDDGYTDTMNSTCDTEVLLEAMDFYGPLEAVKKCKGMFAIALYDRQDECLFLFRDRIGEKPLYYGLAGDGFVFASELTAIRALGEFENRINTDVLGLYLTYGYIPAPYSIYGNVWKLEPGKCLKVKCRINKNKHGLEAFEPEFTTYWSITETAEYGQKNRFKGTRQEAADELERLLTASIKDQMISDVPLGAFLSAGIDSSTVVSLMQSVSERPVRTFTIGFNEKEYNEADAAAEIAAHLGTQHTQLYVTEQDALDVIPHISGMFGEPFGDPSQLPTYLVSRMTRQYVTVSLSGDGGDELFGGYNTYTSMERIWNKESSYPAWGRKAAGRLLMGVPISGSRGHALKTRGRLLGADNPSDLYKRSFEADGAAGRLLKNPVSIPYKYSEMDAAHRDSCMDLCHQIMLMDMEMYHPDDILVKVDRTAMAVSLESRVPMLDKDVVEFAWTLPSEYLRQNEKGKLVLRDVLYKRVPREMMERPKTGFSVPISKWLKEDKLGGFAKDLLNRESINRYNFLNADAIQNLWEDYTVHGIWRPMIWYLLMLLEWLEYDKNITV